MGIKIGVVHVGNAIESEMKKQRLTQYDLAEKLGVTQPSVNKMLKKSSMDTEKLSAMSLLLDYNFFKLFCPEEENEQNNQGLAQAHEGVVPVSLFEKILKERDEYRDQVNDLQNQIALMEKGLSVKDIAQKEAV